MSYLKLAAPVETLAATFDETRRLGLYPKELPKIKVSEVVSKIAFLYEKVRNIVDFKEEHLLRKNATKRSLKRRLLIGSKGKDVALPLIQELIRGGYLPNNEVPEEKIAKVTVIVDRYLLLLGEVAPREKGKERKKLERWFLDVAACEIQEELSPSPNEQALVECLYRSINQNFVIKDQSLKEEEKNIQIYIAIEKALLKADQPMIVYSLLKLYYPDWQSSNSVKRVKESILEVKKIIDLHLNHPLSSYFLSQVQKFTPLFIILKDVLVESGERTSQILADETQFEEAIAKSCVERYREQSIVLRRSIIRSLLYIFITKMLLALIIEVPFDQYFGGSFKLIPFLINLIFHPLFLAFLVLTARKPDSKNTEKIKQGLKTIVYGGTERETRFEIKSKLKERDLVELVFNFFYFITFAASFGLVVFVLHRIHFNVFSISIFLLFLCLVSFFGIKIRHSAKALIVLDKRENILTFIIDLLALPIIRAGRWISLNFSRVNIFVFILDVIIEAPFKGLIEVFEQWLSFIKEKKEQIFRES